MRIKLKHIIGLLFLVMLGYLLFDDSTGALMAFNIAPLMKKPGEVGLPGMQRFVAFIPEHLVTVCPAPKVLEGVVSCELDGSFTFDSSQNFKYIECSNKSVSHGADTQGEEGSKSFLQKGGFVHPGTKKEVVEFAAEVVNTPGFLLMSDREGNQILVGQPGNPVSVTCTSDLGKAATDAKGFTFAWEWDAPVPAYYLKVPVDIVALKKQTVPASLDHIEP